MQNNQIGLFLNWSVIGAQGASGDPRDNQWLGTSWNGSNPNTHVEGTDGTLSRFWVRNTPVAPSNYIPQFNNNGGSGTSLGISTTSGSWSGGCIYTSGASFKTDGALGEDTEDLLSLVAVEEPQTERERSLQYMGHYNLYDMLLENAELTSTNSELETFVAERNADNMGKLHEVINNFRSARAESEDLATGADLMNGVQPENLVEQTLKDVFSILYAHATDLEQINADNELRLREIAQLCPLDYGFGVYTARAALIKLDTLPRNYVSECESVISPEKMSEKRTLEQIEENGFTLYPNPNNGQFTITYKLNELATGEIGVFDMVGKQVFTQTLSTEKNTVDMNLSGMNAGMYLISFKVNGQVRFSERLNILK